MTSIGDNMKAIYILALALLTFSTTTCEKKANTASKDEKISKQSSNEIRDLKNDFDLMQIMIDCNDTFRIEMNYLESLNTSGSFPEETDKTPKCYVRCVLEKSEIASDEGIFDTGRTAEVFSIIRGDVPQSDIKEIATGCADRSESCKCERSYQYLKCLFETEISKYETK